MRLHVRLWTVQVLIKVIIYKCTEYNKTLIKDRNTKMRITYRQGSSINHIHGKIFLNALSDVKLLDLASKLFQGSTTLHAKKLLRARTLQSALTRVYGWPRVILLVLTANKLSTLR